MRKRQNQTDDPHEFHCKFEIPVKFKTDWECARFLEKLRWGKTPHCPHCRTLDPYVINTRRRIPDYKCSNGGCYKKFNVLTKTPLQSTHIPLNIIFAALVALGEEPRNKRNLATEVGMKEQQAQFIIGKFRAICKEFRPTNFALKVSVDESIVGGNNHNRHKDKKIANCQGRSAKGKAIVVGVYNNADKRVIIDVVEDATSKTLTNLLLQHVKIGSVVQTDEYNGYNGIQKYYTRKSVNHSKKEYVRYDEDGRITTNGAETLWSHVIPDIVSTYRNNVHFSGYFQGVCYEFEYRYNNRVLDERTKKKQKSPRPIMTLFQKFKFMLLKIFGYTFSWQDLKKSRKEVKKKP